MNTSEDTSDKKRSWRPGKKDVIFLVLVGSVVLGLALGSHKKTTKPTPDDLVHRTATSRAECMHCHGATGVRPVPRGHTKDDQCFLCHTQPKDWQGPVK
jgi:hypothetical protein